MPHDPVNHPQHYQHASGVETIQIAEQLNFNLGSAFKYLCRHKLKGLPLQDLRKCRWLLNREHERTLATQSNENVLTAYCAAEPDNDVTFLALLIDAMSKAKNPHQFEGMLHAATDALDRLETKINE